MSRRGELKVRPITQWKCVVKTPYSLTSEDSESYQGVNRVKALRSFTVLSCHTFSRTQVGSE